MTTSGVSVIMCCYNSASRLRTTLEYLARQQTSSLSWEIIVVDNASTDDTASLANSLWSNLRRADVPLMLVEQPRPGLSFARAKGVEAARYDILIFCDDDNWLAPNYVQDAFDIMHLRDDLGALGGAGTAVADAPLPSWFDQYKECFACYPQGDKEGELSGVYAFLYGAGLVVRRDALDMLVQRGFKAILPDRIGTKLTSGGDTELSYALRLAGYKLWFSEKLTFEHYLPASRLTEEYLYRLISSLSYCSSLLIVYNYFLQGKKITRMTWLKDAIYQGMFFFKALVRYLRVKQISRERKIGILFSFNRLKGVAAQMGTYRKRDRQIRMLIK